MLLIRQEKEISPQRKAAFHLNPIRESKHTPKRVSAVYRYNYYEGKGKKNLEPYEREIGYFSLKNSLQQCYFS